MMDILMSETCWIHKKWNKIASDIKLVFFSSTITMMHGPVDIRYTFIILIINLIIGFSYKVISNASLSFCAECPEHLSDLHRKCTSVGTPCSKSKSSLKSQNESCSGNIAVLRSGARFVCIVCPLTDRRCSNFPIGRRNTIIKHVNESSCGACISTWNNFLMGPEIFWLTCHYWSERDGTGRDGHL